MTFKIGFIIFCVVVVLIIILIFWGRIRGFISGMRSAKIKVLKGKLKEVEKEKEEYRAKKEEAVDDANEQAKKLDEITGDNTATDYIRNKWYNKSESESN